MAKKTAQKTRRELARYSDFQTVFHSGATSYPSHLIEGITNCRKQLGGSLFFDLLLHSIGIEHGIRKLYPPKDTEHLRELHRQIIESPADASQRQALLYYLLLNSPDLHPSSNSQPENGRDNSGRSHEAQAFAKNCLLPSSYSTVSFGFWLMDRMRFAEALSPLLDPLVKPTLPEEILICLVKHTKPEEHNLAMTYYDAVTPEITTTDNLKAFFAVYSKLNVTQAFFFARQQKEERHCLLVEELSRNVVTDSTSSKIIKAENAAEFINLPFDAQELQWLTRFLTEGELAGSEQASGTLEMLNMSRGLADASHSRLLGFPAAPKNEIWQGLRDADSLAMNGPLLPAGSFDIAKALG